MILENQDLLRSAVSLSGLILFFTLGLVIPFHKSSWHKNSKRWAVNLFFSFGNGILVRFLIPLGLAGLVSLPIFKNLRIDQSKHDVPIEVFKQVVDDVADDKPFIAFNSTEPLIYKPIVEAVDYCTKKGLKTAITTGGYMLPVLAEKLAEAGLTRLNISIDGHAAVHNMIRGRKDSYKRSVDGIQNYHDACKKLGRKSEIILNCTISNLNFKELIKFYNEIEKYPFSFLNFTYLWFISGKTAEEHNFEYGDRFRVTESCYSDFINPRAVDVDQLWDQFQELRDKPRVRFLPDFSKEKLFQFYQKPEEFVAKDSRCMASWFFVQILANGNVIPYSRCHNESLGNIKEQRFSEIWNGVKMKEWRRFIKEKKRMPMCKRCDLAY